MSCVIANAIPYYAHVARRCCVLVQRRYRYKKKWAVNLPSKSPSELALEHFDAFYKPLFGHQWPQVRVSLLSLSKHAAIINSIGEPDVSVQRLTELGAVNLIQEAVNNVHKANRTQGKLRAADKLSNDTTVDKHNDHIQQNDFDRIKSSHEEERVETESSESAQLEVEGGPVAKSADEATIPSGVAAPLTNLDESEQRDGDDSFYQVDGMKNLLTPDAVKNSANLEYFMPTEQVFSEKEQLKLQDYSQNTYEEHAISAAVIPSQLPLLSKSLKVMVFPSGDVSDFPKPSADSSHLLNYYLLDAASILPVIALDVRPGDNVLDLCSAPGGKTLALLQIIMAHGGHLDSNDVSHGRVRRLRTVLNSYLSGALQQEFVTVTEQNGLFFKDPLYHKVLVDVPCNSDRHVLLEEDNNLFKPGRINERLKMTALQKSLLLAAVKSCKPGGSVVYSTCTLAAVQNDGVVQAALEELWETSDIDVAVEDLSPLQTMLAPFFRFHAGSRLGLLVLPSLLNNYGPLYCCKLRRLS